MATDPKAQLNRLVMGIAGVAALAAVAGRFAGGPAAATAATASTEAPAEETPPAQTWFAFNDDDDHDDDHDEDDDDHEEGHHRERGPRLQLAQPGAVQSAGTAPAPRARTRKS